MLLLHNVLVLAVAGFSAVNAAGFTNCEDLQVAISGTQNGRARGIEFCRVFMGITPRTVTTTVTTIHGTRMANSPTYSTQTIQVTPNPTTSVVTLKKTTSVTVVPPTRTATTTITSTAWLANDGTTIAIAKRSLEARARPGTIPVYMTGFDSRELKSACRCIDASRPTVLRTVTRGAFETMTRTLRRNILTTTTLPVAQFTSTLTDVLTKNIRGIAPVVATSVVKIENAYGCPPSTTSTFTCPAGTGDNDFSDTTFQTCSLMAVDGFSGSCVYWSDDGSPVESQLVRGDGSGDPDFDEHRAATYGDGGDDDCPTWADYTCAAAAPQKRAFTEKRTILEERASRNTGSSRNRSKHVPKKMPKTAPRRGGKYVPFAVYQQRRLAAMARAAKAGQ